MDWLFELDAVVFLIAWTLRKPVDRFPIPRRGAKSSRAKRSLEDGLQPNGNCEPKNFPISACRLVGMRAHRRLWPLPFAESASTLPVSGATFSELITTSEA
jgi:hypothetical protein